MSREQCSSRNKVTDLYSFLIKFSISSACMAAMRWMNRYPADECRQNVMRCPSERDLSSSFHIKVISSTNF